ncbi:hypothetical protein KOAAANKH_03693 [Brevundimonas sp. NIBR10]|uniref:DUF979 domain-containing protein n=1 Tax=Brevundimonas sp. NIBR10 TaxID=3015997 RepID=UPI0022F14C14|nr:DUF979 domain-containing protein [Brevundimonas sp. NIBR10]WGM48786.1 hypothetical protein KOAAANKH_03693 [Brevundimonas sp. NIBR10]
MITLTWVYILAGLIFMAFAWMSVTDRENPTRLRNAAFWGLMAVSFLFGSYLGDLGNGVLLVGLVLIGGIGGLGQGRPATTSPEERRTLAARFGNRLFIPALIIPATALLGTLVLAKIDIGGRPLFDAKDPTLIALGLGVLLALVVGVAMFRPPATAPLQEGRRLMDAVGWAAILPQMLAALGAVFALAGVGQVVGGLVADVIPMNGPLIAVIAYCLGMALFTFIMGNAFAAFPVMTAAIGLPFVILQFDGDPAIVCAIGMLSGFCGTLLTPMAANFNVVPANLLELPDRNAAFNGVIRAQAPTALAMLGANIILMYALAFRF